MLTADTNETLDRLRQQHPEEDWDLLVVELLRAGFEFAVDGVELCDEAQCLHDNAQSHVNWTAARREFDALCAEILNARSKEGR